MSNIRWFKELTIKDVPKVGGKNASLGEMYQKLTKKGILIPNGFSVTAEAYHYFLRQTKVDKKIREILKGLDTHNIRDLAKRGDQARQVILSAEFPEDLKKSITDSYY